MVFTNTRSWSRSKLLSAENNSHLKQGKSKNEIYHTFSYGISHMGNALKSSPVVSIKMETLSFMHVYEPPMYICTGSSKSAFGKVWQGP